MVLYDGAVPASSDGSGITGFQVAENGDFILDCWTEFIQVDPATGSVKNVYTAPTADGGSWNDGYAVSGNTLAVSEAGRIGYPVDAPTSMHHGMHAHLENELDAILLWKYKKKKPSEFNQTATICLNGQEIQFISHFLASCINETYYPITYRNNFQVTPAMVHRSIWALRFGCRTLSDKNGKKKFGIAQVESIFVNHPVASAKMVTDSVTDYRSSCNLNHEAWGNPWDPTRVSTASFVDLFHETLDKCSRVYALLNSAVTDNMPLDKQDLSPLLAELGNESYHSGLPVE